MVASTSPCHMRFWYAVRKMTSRRALEKVNVLGMLIQKKTLERAPSCLQSIKEDPFAKQLPWGYDSSGHWTMSSRGDLWTNWNINLFAMYIQYKLPHLSFLGGKMTDVNNFCYKWSLILLFKSLQLAFNVHLIICI